MTTASILLAKALLPSTGPVNAKLSRRRGIMAALMVGAARSGDYGANANCAKSLEAHGRWKIEGWGRYWCTFGPSFRLSEAARRLPPTCPSRSILHPGQRYASFEGDLPKGAVGRLLVHLGPSIRRVRRVRRCHRRLIGQVDCSLAGCTSGRRHCRATQFNPHC